MRTPSSRRLVCGVDSSTQSTKVEVRDLDTGERLAVGRASHPPTSPPRSEQDPMAWWAALCDALGAAAAGLERGLDDVVAISIAGQQHGMVVTDDDGVPLRPAKLWNDTESAPEAAALVAALGGPGAWAERIGSVPVAAFTITKLAWLAVHEPAVWAATRRVMLPHDWLTHRLCGAHATDRGDASGSGWWSAQTNTVDLEVLALVDPDRDWNAMVPYVLGPIEEAGVIRPEAARLSGLPLGCLVAAGTGDNMAAAAGLGLGPGDIVISLGTSGTVYAVAERPTADATGAVAGFADATGRFLPLVCTLNATRVTDTMAALLGADRDELVALALGAPAGSNDLTLLPYLDGERTPNLPTATGSISGLRTTTTRADLARAAHEGVVCGLLAGVDALAAAGVEAHGQAFLVGGGARSAAYRRILADTWGRAIRVPHDDEVVATGACVQAAATVEGRDPVEVGRAWNLGAGDEVEPAAGVDGAAVLAAHRRAAAAAVAGGTA